MIIGEFCDVFPPEVDGVGSVVRNYIHHFNDMGDECVYIAPTGPESEVPCDFKHLHYFATKIKGEPYRMGYPHFDLSYQKAVRDIEFDIIHTHSPFAGGYAGLTIARKRNIPLVATFHSKYYDDFYMKTNSKMLASMGTKLVATYFNKCDEVWTVSEKTVDVLRSYGYRKNIIVMPNGTDIAPADPKLTAGICREFGIPENASILLFVGQISRKKNIFLSLEAAKLYFKDHPDTVFVLAGQGPDEAEARRIAEEGALRGRVIFTGHIADRDKVSALYSRSDLLLFPSVYDNASIVIREAAALNTAPVVIKDSCSSEGIIDNVNGILCDETPESVCEGIARGLASAQSLGLEASRTIPTPWKEIVGRVRERYQYLIDLKKSK